MNIKKYMILLVVFLIILLTFQCNIKQDSYRSKEQNNVYRDTIIPPFIHTDDVPVSTDSIRNNNKVLPESINNACIYTKYIN